MITKDELGKATLYSGDCMEVMPALAENSIDAIITDPPYGIGFMGKQWDHGIPGVEFWRESLRIIKPGAFLLVFGGTRTFHRLACAIEDAGWQIFDTIMWAYGQGFNKVGYIRKPGSKEQMRPFGGRLKPAWEPIIMARKKVAGTLGRNLLEWGTGGLNIDAARIDTIPRKTGTKPTGSLPTGSGAAFMGSSKNRQAEYDKLSLGRWPSNLILSYNETAYAISPSATPSQLRQIAEYLEAHETSSAIISESEYKAMPQELQAAFVELENDSVDEVAWAFPITTTGSVKPYKNGGGWANTSEYKTGTFHGDTGSAARFFYHAPFELGEIEAHRIIYCAKASKQDRDEGYSGLIETPADKRHRMSDFTDLRMMHEQRRLPSHNSHCSVKPTKLLRYICRLVTPPGGTILDNFMGSGSTGKAAMLEGFSFIGIEIDEKYFEIAKNRIAFAGGVPIGGNNE